MGPGLHNASALFLPSTHVSTLGKCLLLTCTSASSLQLFKQSPTRRPVIGASADEPMSSMAQLCMEWVRSPLPRGLAPSPNSIVAPLNSLVPRLSVNRDKRNGPLPNNLTSSLLGFAVKLLSYSTLQALLLKDTLISYLSSSCLLALLPTCPGVAD